MRYQAAALSVAQDPESQNAAISRRLAAGHPPDSSPVILFAQNSLQLRAR